MSTGTNKERLEQNNELLNQIKTTIDNLPSAGSTSEVKLFETEEAMQADTTAKEGDLAIIYRSDIKSVSNGDTITSITFPKTVVFTEAITSNYDGRLMNDSEPGIYLDIRLAASGFMLYDMAGTIREIEYSSTDGITYTRTDSNEDTYEIGETIVQDLDEHICKFMKVGGNVFEGLYIYEPQHKTSKVAFPNFSTSTIDITNKKFIINDTIPTSYNKSIFKNAIDSNYCTYFIDTNNKLKCIVAKRALNELAYDSSGNCIGICTSNVTSSSNYFTSATMYDVDNTGELTNPVQCTCYTFDTTYNIVAMNYTDFKSIPVAGSILANQGNADSGVFRAGMSAIWSNSISTLIKADEYYLAPTQLTTLSDEVYQSIFYGKKGVETGILTENISNSFADNNAEIYNKIKNAYDNMEPRVLTDSDKTIDKNIYFIPTNSKGQVLLDTSAVTNTADLFEGCTNLTTIPLIDTSSTTKTIGMFKDCNNLVTIPLLDTSNVTDTSVMFQNCSNLINVPLLDISKAAEVTSMFYNCTKLKVIPLLDTSNATNMINMFGDCSSLTEIPQLNTSKATRIDRIVSGCTNLSDESLNNILAMCTNATNVTSNKTLKNIGLTSDQATKCTTLSNYSAFTSAGWTTGY